MIELVDPQEAYKEFPGPVLLLAGPGTGKTFQMAHRIKYLVEDIKADPAEITVITFTTAAARSMRERLSEIDKSNNEPFLPKDKHPHRISTMHSLGNSIIGADPKSVGLTEKYDVLHDQHLKKVLFEDAASIAGFDKKEAILAEQYRSQGFPIDQASVEIKKITTAYETILKKCSLLDYDSQILLACLMLQRDSKLLDEWRKKTKYLLVDEYQDVNQPQCELIQLLSTGQREGLFAVGDDDQSIYSFRGGSPEYICNFEDHFGKQSKIGKLSLSRRCPEHILLGAQAIVDHFYKGRVPKPDPQFQSSNQGGNKIYIHDVPTDQKEAEIIAAITKKNIATSKIIIIIPYGKYLPLIKKALSQNGLDFRYRLNLNDKGLIRFSVLADWCSDQNSSSKLRHLIDLIINNYDDLIKETIADTNKITELRLIGSKKIAELWNEVTQSVSLFEVLKKHATKTDPDAFIFGLYDNLRDISTMIEKKGGNRNSLPSFLTKCGLFVAPGKNPNGLLNEVLEWQNELMSSTKATSYEPVQIYNMPSSKGLEADIVFIVGTSEGLLPNPKSDIEEQARLFYVAMTRAKKELHLFSSRTRSAAITFKPASYQLKLSPFISKIPDEHKEMKYVQRAKTAAKITGGKKQKVARKAKRSNHRFG